jgi:nucleotide-binding universal stress UspA family protein
MSAAQEGQRPRIVAGLDGSPSSVAALRWAVRQAGLTGGSVDAVIAWQYPAGIGGFGMAPAAMLDTTDFSAAAGQALRDAVSAAVPPGSNVSVRQLVREGHPARVLIDAAAGADLLAVGCRGHGGFTGALLGSVSQHCVHHAPCPVLVFRGHPDR